MSTRPPALHLSGVTKYFGSLCALNGAALTVEPGTVHALLGENGAGKTTLMRMAFGMIPPDAGQMSTHGHDGWPRSPAQAIARGIGMVHQHFTTIPRMTVAENVALGGRGRFHPAGARRRVQALASTTGLTIDPDAPVEALPVGAQQRLEILKALARDARILILDEPTAVLTPDESDELGRVLRTFAAKDGAVVLITHKLREALGMADQITVLRHGRTVASLAATDASDNVLADAMIGTTDALNVPPRTASRPGRVVFSAQNLTLVGPAGTERVHHVTVDICAGEIVGIAGVEGSGHHELLRALAGRLAPTSGTLERPDHVGFVPEDRHRDALVMEFSLTENVALHQAGRLRGVIAWHAWEDQTRQLLESFDVRPATPASAATTLSGGNQQKLILARELADGPPGLVVENPSRGLDIAATAAVHARLVRARDEGTAIAMYSSDLDELLAIADRVVVLHAGYLHHVPPNRTAVGRAMLGVL